jgi:predicted ATPase/DNA-binding SARP family transcriptional activator
MEARTNIRVLGPLDVEVGGERLRIGGSRQQALLALLVMHVNEVVSTARIADALWRDDLPQDPPNAVQSHVSRLRRALGDDLIVTHAHGYGLQLDGDAIDARRFERLCTRARRRSGDDPAAAAALFDDALSLWRGRPYGDFADEFARSAALRLEELRIAAREQRAALALVLGATDEAVALAGELAAEHPLREGPVEVSMRALYAAGRTADALAAYRTHRSLVDAELGLSPSATLRDLEGRILRDDVSATAPARIGASSPLPRNTSAEMALPSRPSPLVGRDEELRAVGAQLSREPVVTLVGPGGVGKTRLVLEAAHQAYASGQRVWWVDLVAVERERVVQAVASGVGVELAHDDDPARDLCRVLARREGVLCLDNAEHVLDQVARLVERLVTGSPVRVLVTSRERLAIDAETVYVLSPLPVDDAVRGSAVRLFLDRWRRSPGPPSAEDLALVTQVCRDLDGLPLAIELAASRATTLGVRAVADRLGSRFELLTGGRRTADARHQTLRAVIDWSHRLLTADEAALFARLAVFPASFSLTQVEMVCADDHVAEGAIAATLSRLVEQSLVQTGADRFWLLETLRGYAREKLPVDQHAAATARHAHDTADRLHMGARTLWTRDEARAAAMLHVLIPDLHAAWRYAVDNDHDLAARLATDVFGFAYVRQRLDMLRWSVTLLDRHIDAVPPDLFAVAATACWSASDLDRARRLAARGVEVAGGPTAVAAAEALDVEADLAMFDGCVDEAISRYRTVSRLRAPDVIGVLMADIAVAQAHAYGPRWAAGLNQIDDLLARAHAAANPTALTFAWFAAGELRVNVDRDAALEAYEQAVAHGTRADSRLFVTIARGSAAAEHAVDGAIADTARELTELITTWEQLDNAAGHWSALASAVTFLARLDVAEQTATVAAAVRANLSRTWRFPRTVHRLERAIADVCNRLPAPTSAAALAHGATLSRADTTAVVRAVLDGVAG